MSFPSVPLILATSSADSAAVTTTAATTILHGSGVGTIPAGALQIGSFLKATLRGRMNTVVTTPGTTTFDMRFGAVVISALGAIPLNTVAQTNATFTLELIARIVTLGTGTTATAIVTGEFRSRAIIGSATAAAGGVTTWELPDTAPAVGTGFDSTIAQTVNIFVTNTVAGSITVHKSIIELKV
jgi:hypothetical protein